MIKIILHSMDLTQGQSVTQPEIALQNANPMRGNNYIDRVYVNSLWPSDAIRRQGTESTLAQVMACCLTAPSLYLNNVDLSSVRACGIHLRAISQEIPQPPFTKTSLKINYSKLNWNLPGAKELSRAMQCGIPQQNTIHPNEHRTVWLRPDLGSTNWSRYWD